MQLTLQATGDINLIQSYDDHSLTINGEDYRSTLILTPTRIQADWDLNSIGQLDAEKANQLASFDVELVLIGSGQRIEFPSPEFQKALLRNGIGLETMDNRAACRTYNVLATEGRAVLLGIIL